ncbi:MAG: Rpn family recombination-promoting nuclease/putative transposase [Microcystis sp. LE19-84.1B]|uniref:Rpn family recombination-promoting nuclease/putative transposase n=1 Tax=Microcystis sp. LE19-84.1B TaxID=3016438 RepID=UPI0022CCA4B0|nr:Rpn family recombination-promoting nuclease/putative transposase [Microcystis sp. LE19-84.1B]MCZ8222845.1 Rpn family recombination-promoting nuclease/putative transposase [Microcystis sp. LE19-84.1B]
MYDNVCRILASLFSRDIATWLIGEPITLTELEPTELLLDPIRVDSLIFLQSEDLILHIEFQTDPKEDIPFSMADYRLRIYRQFPRKRVYQVVIYLRKNQSAAVKINTFELLELQHRYNVVRLWEVPSETFLDVSGLLPFAVLSQTDNPAKILQQVARQIEKISDNIERNNIAASTGIIAGLVLNQSIIKRLLKEEIMKESVIYQEILAKGITEGEILGFKKGEANLILKQINRRVGNISTDWVNKIQELSLEQLEDLGEALLDFTSQSDLINWFNYLEENKKNIR